MLKQLLLINIFGYQHADYGRYRNCKNNKENGLK